MSVLLVSSSLDICKLVISNTLTCQLIHQQDSLFEFNTISGFFIQLKLMWLVDQPKAILTSVLYLKYPNGLKVKFRVHELVNHYYK